MIISNIDDTTSIIAIIIANMISYIGTNIMLIKSSFGKSKGNSMINRKTLQHATGHSLSHSSIFL